MGRDTYSTRQTIEECSDLNIFRLNRNNLFNGNVVNATLSWKMGIQKKRSIGIQVSTIEGNEHCRLNYTISNWFSEDKKEMDYIIRLVSTKCNYGGRRWWFLCPLTTNGIACNRRVGTLYLGGNYFGCRTCNNLTYYCQKDAENYRFLKDMENLRKEVEFLRKMRKKLSK